MRRERYGDVHTLFLLPPRFQMFSGIAVPPLKSQLPPFLAPMTHLLRWEALLPDI